MSDKRMTDPYLLSHLHNDRAEDHRLNRQHETIQDAILGNRLFHHSIPVNEIRGAIADVACGTGIWLHEAGQLLSAGSAPGVLTTPQLTGFDINSHAFNLIFSKRIEFVEHDAKHPFPARFCGKYDLVNIRGLAYALTEHDFSAVIFNALRLLRPGGYLQWLETDMRLFEQIPTTNEFEEAIAAINAERQARDLTMNMPAFMMREILRYAASDGHEPDSDAIIVQILHFELLPGGVCRMGEVTDSDSNRRLSHIILESMLRVLEAIDQRCIKSTSAANMTQAQGRTDHLGNLIAAIESACQSDETVVGGKFPQLIARRLGDDSDG